MSAATTRAPSRARRSAVARPMPEPAPVTIAVLPVKRPGVNAGSGVRSAPAWRRPRCCWTCVASP